MICSTATAMRSLNEQAYLQNELFGSEELPELETILINLKKQTENMKNLARLYRVSVMDAETFEEKRYNVSRKRENAEKLARNARRNGFATRITEEE